MSATALAARAARHARPITFFDGERWQTISFGQPEVEPPDLAAPWDYKWPSQWGPRPAAGDATTVWFDGVWPRRYAPDWPWRGLVGELGTRVVSALRRENNNTLRPSRPNRKAAAA